MENLTEKLKTEIEKVKWPLLEEHHKRGALLILDKELDLVHAAVAIAKDDVASVKEWLLSKKLLNPTEEMIQSWEETPEIDFNFLIIQPYVIAQKTNE